MEKLNYPIVVLLGLQASGKDTILQKLTNEFGYNPIISSTSRPIRPSEENHREYHFKSYDEMKQLQDNNELIESRIYHTLVGGNPQDWIYGVEETSIDKTKQQIVILDRQGLQSFVDYFGKENVVSFGVVCPERIRRQRCINRGSYDETEWNRREKADGISFGDYDKVVDYTIYNNGTASLDIIAKGIYELVSNRITK